MSTSGKGKKKDKKTKKVTASVIKTKKSKTKQNPWSAFWATSITTVVVFWVLFPFYSFQLQLILDQRQCKGESSTDPGAGGGGNVFYQIINISLLIILVRMVFYPIMHWMVSNVLRNMFRAQIGLHICYIYPDRCRGIFIV